MTTTRRLSLAYLALTAGLAVLFALNLFWGSVELTPGAVAAALLGRAGMRWLWASCCSCACPGP